MPPYLGRVGTKCIKVVEGGGFRTATFKVVESVEANQIALVGDDYLRYSTFSMNEINPVIPGFRSYLVMFDDGEEGKVD